MRRALGLDGETPPISHLTHSHTPSNGPHQRRQFARDGDVPVTIVHSDSGSRLQQLDAARQALRSKPRRARRPSGCWWTRVTPSTISRQSWDMSVCKRRGDAANQCRASADRGSAHCSAGGAGDRACGARAGGKGTRRGGRCHADRRGSGRRSKLGCQLRRPYPAINPHAAAGALRRSRGRMLLQTIPRSWSGGRPVGKRSTGRELLGAWSVNDP